LNRSTHETTLNKISKPTQQTTVFRISRKIQPRPKEWSSLVLTLRAHIMNIQKTP